MANERIRAILEKYKEWKRIDDEDEQTVKALNERGWMLQRVIVKDGGYLEAKTALYDIAMAAFRK
ncbi:MAG: hypothetical protein WC520_03415 [Candidatus Paceibacterota bacterium]